MMNAFFKSILVFSVILVAQIWAANQDIAANAYVLKDPLVIKPDLALLPDAGGKILPSLPTHIEPGFLYLRKKLDPKTYAWYKGKAAPNALQLLKAFAPSGVNVDSLVLVKFYASRIEKAFQDESEIYFDANFIYSPRVPRLYYAENDQWVELNAQVVGLGSLDVSTNVAAQVLFDGDSIGITPVQKNGVLSGLHTLKLLAPGFLPIVSGVLVSPGQASRKSLQLLPVDSSRFSASQSVAMSTVLDASALPQLEPIWDKLQVEKQAYETYLAQQKKHFDEIYPTLMPAPVGVSSTDPAYLRYRVAFNQVHDEAYGVFLSSVLTGGKELEEILRVAQQHKDSLESLVLTAKVDVEGARVVPSEERKGTMDLRIKFKSPDGRIDAGWTGPWADSLRPIDSLKLAGLDTSDAWHLVVTYQNKPVSLPHDSVIVRRQYRLLKLQLVGPKRTLDFAHGRFVFPDFIWHAPEVVAWLNNSAPQSTTDSAVAAKPVVKAIDESPIWLKALRGDVVEIDGGTFRYKGKTVEMSPFAINRTEVTQEHYQRIMLENPALRHLGTFVGPRKPVHNVTWEDADQFCREIGGQLPTEAQWEYAARAGSSTGELWQNDHSTPADYAVYAANDFKLGKKDPAYGPHEVGQGRPNAWGLYDVSGNVAEWTNDYDSWFHFFVDSKDPQGAWIGSDRVFKGGSWKDDVDEIKLTAKDYEDPRYWGQTMGMRCAFPSHQIRSLDSIKTFLLKQDSIAAAKKFVLIGGSMKELLARANEPATKTMIIMPPPVVKTAAEYVKSLSSSSIAASSSSSSSAKSVSSSSATLSSSSSAK